MKNTDISLAVIVFFTMQLHCTWDNNQATVDPCPGWPCFKVGHEWVYSHNTHTTSDAFFWYADSVVNIDEKSYLRIIKQYKNSDDTIYFRSQGDSLFCKEKLSYFRSYGDSINCTHYYNEEYLRWIYGAPSQTQWWQILTNELGITETTALITSLEIKDFKVVNYYGDTLRGSEQEQSFQVYENGIALSTPHECWIERISKEYGLMERSSWGGSTHLASVNFIIK
jgi:hypothetical protein